MKIQILDPAKDDLAEAFVFYETLEPGSGSYFLTTVFLEIDKLEYPAGSHPKYHPPYYQMFADKFPYRSIIVSRKMRS